MNLFKRKKMLSTIDYNLMVSIIANEKWTEVYNEIGDFNKCYSVFNDIIKSVIDISTTCKVFSVKNKRLKEWMTNGLLTSARRKKYLSIKCKKHPNNQWLALHYKKYRNSFTNTVRLAKLKFCE